MVQIATISHPSSTGTRPEHVRSTESAVASQVYLDAIRQETARVISLMDREPFSPTLGCMDRTYWAWKFTDFPGARFQEGLCVLSFLYATQFDGNELYQQRRLLEWIANGIDYWVRIQYPGGDFDEAYPYERSLAATAFTSFYLAEAFGFLGDQLPVDNAQHLKGALARAGDWLIKNDETHGFLSNHLAAAAAALLHIHRITMREVYLDRSRFFLDRILEHQSSEGWYEEYGGADPGYQTHGTFYLTRYWQLEEDPAVKSALSDSLARSLEFLVHFIHPDGSIGGEYGSRNTQTYYPAAFEMLSSVDGSAHWIAAQMLNAVQDASAAGLRTVDIYNYFPMLNNYVFAHLACLQEEHRTAVADAPSSEPGNTHFPEAGIIKVRKGRYDAFVGLSKGGVIKAYDRKEHRLLYSDCGYIGQLRNGKLFSSQWFGDESEIDVRDRELVVDGWFYQISKPIMRPWRFLGFRGFSLTVGRLPKVSYWLKSILVRALIYRKRRLDLRFRRAISLMDEQIVVEDYLHGGSDARIESLTWQELFTTIHMGSSRYFIPNELTAVQTNRYQRDVDPTTLEEGIVLKRVVTLD